MPVMKFQLDSVEHREIWKGNTFSPFILQYNTRKFNGSIKLYILRPCYVKPWLILQNELRNKYGEYERILNISGSNSFNFVLTDLFFYINIIGHNNFNVKKLFPL
jgi:hypothetical protein